MDTNTAAHVVCPGEELGHSSAYISGAGTYEEDGRVFAAKCGRVTSADCSDSQGRPQVSVDSAVPAAAVPQPGDVVTCRVTRVQRDKATVEVVCVGAQKLNNTFQGVVRSVDVRKTETDKVAIQECFRPSDLVRARVMALGTMREYRLTTAAPELGVVWARSLAGAPMAAVSWTEMRCPETDQIEPRKVAKLAEE